MDTASVAMGGPELSFPCLWQSLLILLILTYQAAPLARAAEFSNEPTKDLQSECIVDSWQTEQGLPDNFINRLAQTPDGYLWIATFNGLARFNGVEFVTFDAANTPEMPDSRITWLEVDGAGRLWIRSETGRLSWWADGRFRLFGKEDGLRGEPGAIQMSSSGNLVIAATYDSTNYLRFNGKIFEPARRWNHQRHSSSGFLKRRRSLDLGCEPDP